MWSLVQWSWPWPRRPRSCTKAKWISAWRSTAKAANYETFRRWLVVPDDAGLQNPDAEELLMDAAERVPGIEVGEYIEEADRIACPSAALVPWPPSR